MLFAAKEKDGFTGSRCHCINIRRAANIMTDYYDYLLAPYHLTVNQYSLLKNIQRIQPCNVSTLADTVRLERTTLVRNLKPLLEAGLVEDLAPAGTRNRKLVLTDRGNECLEAADSAWQQAQADIELYLGADDLRHLLDTLLKLEKMTWKDGEQ